MPKGPRTPAAEGRAALYLRVSTAEQDVANQVPELERLAERRGWSIVATYEEQVSGAALARPELRRLLVDAHRGRFEVVLVWALDRLGRSMSGTLSTVLELDQKGVRVVSAAEPWLDATGPVRSLLVAVFAWVAEQERARLGERTRAGLARARGEGKALGRPKARIAELGRARELIAAGQSVREVAKALRVAPSTLHRKLAAVPKTGPSERGPK
jgi:putative DNA-invertase from lambdoid prophage Rac